MLPEQNTAVASALPMTEPASPAVQPTALAFTYFIGAVLTLGLTVTYSVYAL